MSPCNKICRIDPENNLCIGCLRTIEEISNWINLSEKELENIINEVEKRRANLENFAGEKM